MPLEGRQNLRAVKAGPQRQAARKSNAALRKAAGMSVNRAGVKNKAARAARTKPAMNRAKGRGAGPTPNRGGRPGGGGRGPGQRAGARNQYAGQGPQDPNGTSYQGATPPQKGGPFAGGWQSDAHFQGIPGQNQAFQNPFQGGIGMNAYPGGNQGALLGAGGMPPGGGTPNPAWGAFGGAMQGAGPKQGGYNPAALGQLGQKAGGQPQPQLSPMNQFRR